MILCQFAASGNDFLSITWAPYKGGHRISRPYRVASLIGCAQVGRWGAEFLRFVGGRHSTLILYQQHCSSSAAAPHPLRDSLAASVYGPSLDGPVIFCLTLYTADSAVGSCVRSVSTSPGPLAHVLHFALLPLATTVDDGARHVR